MKDIAQKFSSKKDYFNLLEKSIICYEKSKDLKAGKNIGVAYYHLEEFEIAIDKFENLIRLAEKEEESYYEMLQYIATAYGKMGIYEKALGYYEKLIDSSRRTDKYNGHMGKGIILIRMGRCGENKSLFDLALQQLDLALGYTSCPKKIAAVNSNMAEVYQARAEHEIAISLYKKALLDHEVGRWRAETLNSLALSLAYVERFREALKCVNEAYTISVVRNYQAILANNFYVQGIIHKLQGQYEKAYILLDQAKQLSDQKGIVLEYAETCYILAELEKEESKAASYKAEHDLILKQLRGGGI